MSTNKNERFSIRRWFGHYESTIFAIYGIIVLIISLAASIVYLENKEFATPFRKFVAIIISTIGLFTTNNVSSIGEKTPFIYELARLLAPVMTGYSIFKVVESGLRYFLLPIKYILPYKRLLIFGNNKHSKAFAYNSNTTTGDKSFDVIVIADDIPVSKEEKVELQRSKIFVQNFSSYRGVDDANNLRKSCLKQLFIKKYQNIALLYDDPLTNYLVFQSIVNLKINNDKYKNWKVNIALKSNDINVTRSIEDYYNKCNKEDIKLIIFSEEELEAINLFNSDRYDEIEKVKEFKFGIYNNCIDVEKDKVIIKNPDVLIVDFNMCSQEVLKKTIQTFGLIDNAQRPSITILSKDRNKVINYISKNIPAISDICDFDVIDKEIDSPECEMAIRKLIDNDLSHIFVCHDDEIRNIAFLNSIKTILDESQHENNIYICVRAEEDPDLLNTIKKTAEKENTKNKYQIFDFGTLNYILNYENIFREKWEEESMQVNKNYHIINNNADKGTRKEQLWSDLTYELKDANRVVALNKPFFNSFIKTLECEDKIKEYEDIIFDKDVSKDKKIMDMIKKDESLYILSSLEHTRWLNFKVSRGFGSVEHPIKASKKKLVEKEILGKKLPVYITTHKDLIEFDELFTSDPEVIKNDVCNIIWYSKGELLKNNK